MESVNRYLKTIALAAAAAMLSVTVRAGDVVTDTLGFVSQSATSVAEFIKGNVSGVMVSNVDGNINGLENVNIRGINSVRGDSQPLWVVDGVILNTDINKNLDAFKDLGLGGYSAPTNPLAFLSPYDIDKIEVLKNTSATALYGARGANGVILITTKHDRQDNLTIKWNSNMTVNIPGVNTNGTKASVGQNHYVSLSGRFTKTLYYLSAQYRNANGVVTGKNRSDYVTVTAGLDAIANDFMQFGMRSILSMGKQFNAAGTANYGYSSMMTAIRGITNSETVDAWANDFDDEAQDSRIAASIFFNVRLAKGFYWKNNLGIDFQNYNRLFWYGTQTAYGNMNEGVSSILGNSIFRDNFKTSFEYGRFFGKHRLDVGINGEQFFVFRKYNAMQASTFFSEILRNRGLSIGGAYGNPDIHELRLTQFAASATASYNYDEIVGAKASFTASFTKTYLDKPEYYPSAEAYFDFGKLFLKKSGAVSTLKVDGGYGWSGLTDYNYADPAIIAVPVEVAHYYKNLTQLQSKEWHATFTAGFAADRVKIGVTYYDKQTIDKNSLMCFGQAPAEGSPADALWQNADKSTVKEYSSRICNKGYEVDIDAKVIKRKFFTWNLSANFAYNANRMAEVATEDIFGMYNANVPGYPVGSLYGYDEALGVQSLLGNPAPKYIGGLTNYLRYKDLYFDFLIDGAYGQSILNLNRMLECGGTFVSGAYVEDASYLRLSRFSVGYNIPLGLKFVKSFDVKLSGTNLLTLTKYKGWNPDVNSYGTSPMSAGADYGSYPYVRTIVLGISVKF